ncbi:MAG: 3,4-dehydroadipyl-CoA semialdehyde dehydrogenase [Myxococcales bacterium]|nr:3,4-dehydroadipyl-CoA semialdehyde dehydrogenase [Myxococcales bacterium]
METLQSYVNSQWRHGDGEWEDVLNPSTEEVLARTSTRGIDMDAVLHHARSVGGHTIRNMTFAERGEMLKAVAQLIHQNREELIHLAMINAGNTRSDAKFDIDGASGTLAYYSSLGKKIGNIRYLVDGEDEQLGRDARFFGRHILTPLRGAVIAVNAYNFPAWGFAEKAAAAWLAGMPVVVKPAVSTALVAAKLIRLVVEAKIVPDGALSFIAGPPGTLVDHIKTQDVLAFTGSFRTGSMLRNSASITEHNVRVNMEADSINAAVLDPQTDLDSETYTVFINDVFRDMTQKTGQKCTAIRRVFVPDSLVEVVVEDLVARLKTVVVGNPLADGVTMGPLVSQDQRDRVLRGVAVLQRHARTAFGNLTSRDRIGSPPGRGYFVDPILLVATTPIQTSEIHHLEVFGPVATVIPYSGNAEHVANDVAQSAGGLVVSVYSDDRRFIEEFVLNAAPYHGRIYIGNSKVADVSLGPGAVPPQLIHGGPGRAGGGEELGGVRGLHHFMQRTAIQGYRPLLEKCFSGE